MAGGNEFQTEITDWEGGRTATSSTIPYVSHKVFESNAALQAFVCSIERNTGSGLSKLLAGDVHLS